MPAPQRHENVKKSLPRTGWFKCVTKANPRPGRYGKSSVLRGYEVRRLALGENYKLKNIN